MNTQKQVGWKPNKQVINVTVFDAKDILIMSGLDISEQSRQFTDYYLKLAVIESNMIIEGLIDETNN